MTSTTTATTTTTFSSTQLFQDFLGKIHSRKLLQPITSPPPPPPPPPSYSLVEDYTLDSNVVTVLSFLICAIICSIGLNFLTKCVLSSCSGAVNSSDSGAAAAAANSSTQIAEKGIKQKALKTFPVVKYSADLNKLPGLDTECVICLSEFFPGERLRLLPKCNHGFHVRCIDKWLKSHSSCPKCRNCLIETCQKIVGRSQGQATPSGPSLPVHQEITVVSDHVSSVVVVPLEPEGMVTNYRGLSEV